MLLAQGNTYQLPVRLRIDGELITPENAEVVEFAFDANGVHVVKNYPESVTFEGDRFILPLSQEDTFALQGKLRYQIRVLFKDGNVKSSDIITGAVKDSISKVVLK